jgi:ATP-dependent helicase HrpA
LIDRGTHVEIEVFDEPAVAAARHRAGLRRLVALQLKEPLKYLEKNIPDLQKMAAAYMSLGTLEELREQIIDVALDRAFLADPLPTDAAAFKARIEQGRTRLNLIAAEVARLARHGAGGMGRGAAQAEGRKAAEGGGRRHRRAVAAAVPKRFVARPTGRRCSTCRAT